MCVFLTCLIVVCVVFGFFHVLIVLCGFRIAFSVLMFFFFPYVFGICSSRFNGFVCGFWIVLLLFLFLFFDAFPVCFLFFFVLLCFLVLFCLLDNSCLLFWYLVCLCVSFECFLGFNVLLKPWTNSNAVAMARPSYLGLS